MTDKTTEALKLAEEVLDMVTSCSYGSNTRERVWSYRALAAIRESLAEPEITTPDVCGEVCARAKLCYGCGKAFDEALADHIADAGKVIAEPVTISCDCGDMYERNSFGGKFIQQYGCCPNCDAAEPVKQEPVAKVTDVFPTRVEWLREVAVNSLLYAAPVSENREWVDLTDDELKAALEVHQVGLSVRIGRIAIAAFKEKNK